MVVVESTMVKLGSEMPEFALTDVVSREIVSWEDFEDFKGFLVMFISNHCPYVHHIADELSELTNYYEGSGLAMVGISSNDTDSYPEDAPSFMVDMAEEYDFGFPVLFDENQEVAREFTASCTPDFFLYAPSANAQGKLELVYRGQFDDSRPGNGKKVTGEDLKNAIEAVLAGKKPDENQKPSSGCNIKWKVGNEPNYSSK